MRMIFAVARPQCEAVGSRQTVSVIVNKRQIDYIHVYVVKS